MFHKENNNLQDTANNLVAGYWYKCLKSTPEQYFTKNGIYKCNIKGYLQNSLTNNVLVVHPEYFIKVDMEKEDLNHVSHYEKGRKISPFDVIIDWGLDFFTGNTIKYIARLGRKLDSSLTPLEKSIEDLDKAIVYLTRKKELLIKEFDKDTININN